jgi:predicted histidine transporter YuiF (NhaC family)
MTLVMNNAAWFLLVGGLLLAMGLTTSFIRRLPITSAMIYLAVGILVGHMVSGLIYFNSLMASV